MNFFSPIYTAEKVWHGSDKNGTRTKKRALIPRLHVFFSTVLSGVKLCFGAGKRLNILSSVHKSFLVRMRLSP